MIDGSISNIGQIVTLDSVQSHHACVVLRLKVGDCIGLLDGQGGMYQAQIHLILKKEIQVCIQDIKRQDPPSFGFSIVLSLIKDQGLQIAVQKSAELGARNIYLVHSQNSLHFDQKRLDNKIKKLQTLSQESLKQCQSPFLMNVVDGGDIQSFFCRHIVGEKKYLLVPPDQFSRSQTSFCQQGVYRESLFFIGPEGGWSEEEWTQICGQSDFELLCLSPYILRAETAVVCAGAYFNHRYTVE